MSQGRPLLVAKLENRGMLTRFVRAALLHEVAHVPLAEVPRGAGTHTLQLRLGASPVFSVSAEPVGTGASDAYPLRLRPLDPSHIAELKALLGDEAAPMSASSSAIFDEHPPLPQAGRPPMESITLPNGPDAPPSSNDDHDASVLFDPEAALISRAPARPAGTSAEDTLTVPVRASTFPAPTEPNPPRARASVVPVKSAPPPPEPPRAPKPSEVSIVVEFDASASKPATTQRNASQADAVDPSIGGSVCIDPDVMAREQRTSGAPAAAASPADGESISVIFGDEKTAPDVATTSQAIGVHLKGASVEPVAIATGRRPSVRRDPRAEEEDDVDQDADTLLRDSARQTSNKPPVEPVIESRAMTSSARRGPATQKRTQVDLVAGRTIANKYRIQSLVGSGAVGAVYKAAHTELERTVAIKVLHPHYRQDPHLMQQFRAEARAASLLHHPNVTVVHDFGEEPDGLVYIVMEYLQGWTLQTVLDEERRLPLRRAGAIMLQVCAALATAHERGIVHRDVKPDNIILIPTRDDDGKPAEVVKVCDFGIAALESAPSEDDEYTAGTPEYMAPEQAAGRADARTDVYACGIVLYEMLSGAVPFVADSPIATLKKHVTDPVRPPSEIAPDISPATEALIMRALEKAPERRWQSVREMRAELKRHIR